MTATFLLSECLEIIFLNLLDEIPSSETRTYTSTKDLYSCTLVSRYWCRISTPILYAYPFHHFRNLSYSDIYIKPYGNYSKLIRTLLSCIPKSEIEKIIKSNSSNIEKLFNFLRCGKNYPSSPSFNYISFIRGIIFDKTLFDNRYKSHLYQEAMLSPCIVKRQLSIPMINHLVKFLCMHCNNLKTLEFPYVTGVDEFFENTIELLTVKDCNGKSKLSDLKELYYIPKDSGLSKDLYLALSDSTRNLSLLYNKRIRNIEEAKSLSRFISLQSGLQHIILSECVLRLFFNNVNEYYNIVFNSLSTQSESLQVLEFTNIPFNRISKKALYSLCSLKNIRKLVICCCININNLNAWAKNLTKLEVLEYKIRTFSEEFESFLIQIIQTSRNLNKLVIDFDRKKNLHGQLYQQIPLCLPSLTHLELPKIYPDEIISIFKACTQLIYLSAILSIDGLWEENFKILGKFIPKNLQKIRFKKFNHFIFSKAALRCFFEDCEYSNGKLRRLEVTRFCGDIQEYLDIANEFGVEFCINSF